MVGYEVECENGKKHTKMIKNVVAEENEKSS